MTSLIRVAPSAMSGNNAWGMVPSSWYVPGDLDNHGRYHFYFPLSILVRSDADHPNPITASRYPSTSVDPNFPQIRRSEAQQASALRHVELLFNAGTTIGLSDRQLLERFLDQGDGPRGLAFAALLERHGPMVHRVCQSILQNQHAVDDAFQATFLILVRRAAHCGSGIRLGPGSIKSLIVSPPAQSTEARRRRHERRTAPRIRPVRHDPTWTISSRRLIKKSPVCLSVIVRPLSCAA